MASVASLYRHPVKGLTPEPLDSVGLKAGEYFPGDRNWAVEAGPSGFNPEKPGHISKQKFTVLARFPSLARLRTRLEDPSLFHIGDASGFGIATDLSTEDGRDALARFLQAYLGDEATGQNQAKFRVLSAPGHRFTDHPLGHVSVINLASVRALGWAIESDRPRRSADGVNPTLIKEAADIDPLRFRANVYVDGLPPWAEDDLAVGQVIGLGAGRLKMFKPIVRCIATHANPTTGERDLDTVDLLRRHFGRDTLGNYFSVEQGGRIASGDVIGFS